MPFPLLMLENRVRGGARPPNEPKSVGQKPVRAFDPPGRTDTLPVSPADSRVQITHNNEREPAIIPIATGRSRRQAEGFAGISRATARGDPIETTLSVFGLRSPTPTRVLAAHEHTSRGSPKVPVFLMIGKTRQCAGGTAPHRR